MRLNPIDLVAPAGTRLRLTVAGSSIVYDGLDGVAPGLGAIFQGPTMPSGLVQPVTILHDAAHPSALRFTLPEAGSTVLDLRAPVTAGASGTATSVPTGPPPPASATLPATGGEARPGWAALALAAGLLAAWRARLRSSAGGARINEQSCSHSRPGD